MLNGQVQQSLLDEDGAREEQDVELDPAVDGTASSNETPEINNNRTTQQRKRRTPGTRPFPPTPFEEALELPAAIQRLASGQRVRRLRLFELLARSPESSTTRSLITSSLRYGLTTGSYSAEWLELTPDGRIATAENVPERERIRARYKLAIEQFTPFKKLHDQFVTNRLPAKSIMADFLRDEGMSEGDVSECVDLFLLNAKFINVLQNISGAERLVSLEYVLDYAPAGVRRQIIEHILRARLVVADLSFHNPNVFYELALRHASGLPTVQVMRASDRIPFDVNQVRTIQIDTSTIYALVPQLDVYRSAIASQVRRALETPDTVDSPVSAFAAMLRGSRHE